MNIINVRRLSILFTLLCVAAAATHPGTAFAKKAPPVAAVPSATDSSGAASAAGDHAAATVPAASDHGDFNDDSSDEHISIDLPNGINLHRRHRVHINQDGNVVSVGHSSHLLSGQKADSVVSVFGSSTSEGQAVDVVSVMGTTRVTGPVSDSAVAVLGNVYIDSKVDGDVVAVLGSVKLGPSAEVGGDVVAVLGGVDQDPAAVIHGSVQRIMNIDLGEMSGFSWLNTWINKCLLYGRPLAFAPGLGWAWTLALGLLAFYACLALMFRSSVDQCVQTLESQPGHTALAALLGILLTPVLLILLCVTLIGIAAVPFVVAALFCMSLFGKAVVLAWLGGRISGRRPGPSGHPAVAVLIGGAVALVLYVVPMVGFLVYKLLGFFGFGAVLYTLVLRQRARRVIGGPLPGNPPPGGAAMAGAGWSAGAAPAAAAAAAAAAGATAYAAAAAPGPSVAADAVPPASGVPPASAAPPYVAPTPPPVNATPQITAAMPRAGFWVRMGALFLDVLLVGFALTLVHPFGDFHIVVLAIYGAVMWKLRGTTVGGIVFDLHVVRIDGRPIDWETAIVRALGCFLSLAVVFLGFIWIAFDANNQAWHDKIAGTVVVRARRGAPLA
jgi:RDD family